MHGSDLQGEGEIRIAGAFVLGRGITWAPRAPPVVPGPPLQAVSSRSSQAGHRGPQRRISVYCPSRRCVQMDSTSLPEWPYRAPWLTVLAPVRTL
jgi:hypothetical protein